MKRFLAAAGVAAGLLVASPANAGAWVVYCDWDPLVLVVTPGGHIVPVYDSVWTSNLLNIGLPLESYKTSRVYDSLGRPETAVDMSIYVPSLLWRFAVYDAVNTGLLGSGQLLAGANGTSGTTVHLHFVLPES